MGYVATGLYPLDRHVYPMSCSSLINFSNCGLKFGTSNFQWGFLLLIILQHRSSFEPCILVLVHPRWLHASSRAVKERLDLGL